MDKKTPTSEVLRETVPTDAAAIPANCDGIRARALYDVLWQSRELLARRNLDGSLTTGRKEVAPLRDAVAAFDAADEAAYHSGPRDLDARVKKGFQIGIAAAAKLLDAESTVPDFVTQRVRALATPGAPDDAE